MLKPTAVLTVLATSIVLAACSGADPSAPTTESSAQTGEALDQIEPGMKVHWQKGAQPQASSTGNLIDHGGRVLPVANAYAIYWGNASSFPTDLSSGVSAYFNGLTSTSFLGIATQYMRGASNSVSYKGSYSDSSSPPSRGPSTSTIVNEACKVINANGLTADPTAIYFVFTSNFPGGHVNYCAWHSSGTCNGTTIQVAYMPNTTGMAGCDPGNTYNCNSFSQGTRSIINVTSHEMMEAITDADPGSTTGAWTDSSGSEIGDKCAWTFSSCVSLSTGKWQLQQEWSNAISGCQQQ